MCEIILNIKPSALLVWRTVGPKTQCPFVRSLNSTVYPDVRACDRPPPQVFGVRACVSAFLCFFFCVTIVIQRSSAPTSKNRHTHTSKNKTNKPIIIMVSVPSEIRDAFLFCLCCVAFVCDIQLMCARAHPPARTYVWCVYRPKRTDQK